MVGLTERGKTSCGQGVWEGRKNEAAIIYEVGERAMEWGMVGKWLRFIGEVAALLQYRVDIWWGVNRVHKYYVGGARPQADSNSSYYSVRYFTQLILQTAFKNDV